MAKSIYILDIDCDHIAMTEDVTVVNNFILTKPNSDVGEGGLNRYLIFPNFCTSNTCYRSLIW